MQARVAQLFYENKVPMFSNISLPNAVQEMQIYLILKLYIMALPVMEFQDQGYKIRKVFA